MNKYCNSNMQNDYCFLYKTIDRNYWTKNIIVFLNILKTYISLIENDITYSLIAIPNTYFIYHNQFSLNVFYRKKKIFYHLTLFLFYSFNQQCAYIWNFCYFIKWNKILLLCNSFCIHQEKPIVNDIALKSREFYCEERQVERISVDWF